MNLFMMLVILLNIISCKAKFNHPFDGINGFLFDSFLTSSGKAGSPTITIKINDTEYKNGDTFTFNTTKTNYNNTQSIQIVNNSSVSLNITGAITVTGTNSANFTVTQPSLTTLIPGGTTTFSLAFRTSELADKIGVLNIPNDDLNNSKFVLNVIGKFTGTISGQFFSTGSMNKARYNHTATLLTNGKVLITGGTMWSETFSSAELYDPITGTFSFTGSMSISRYGHTATLLSNGKVLVTGGYDANGGTMLASAELYDQNSGVFTITGNLAQSKSNHTATLLGNGKVLIYGGFAPGNPASPLTYDYNTSVFSSSGTIDDREYHSSTLLNNGMVLIASGTVYGVNTLSAKLYNPSSGATSNTGSLSIFRQGHAAVLLASNKVLIMGGGNFGLASTELYDPSLGTFSTAASMNLGRKPVAIMLNTGKVLVVGGNNTAVEGELYDSNTDTFSLTGAMLVGSRFSATIITLSNGKILIVGGYSNSVPLSSAEIYYP